MQPFGHNTPTLQTEQDNGPMAQGKPFYKWSHKNVGQLLSVQCCSPKRNSKKRNMELSESRNKSSAVAEMGDRGHNSVGCHSSA